MNKTISWQEFQNELVVRALKNANFRKELLADPKAVLEKEMGKLTEGFKFPADMEVKVIEQPANALYLVLPTLPEKKLSGELSDEVLAKVAGGTGTAAKNECDGCSMGFFPNNCQVCRSLGGRDKLWSLLDPIRELRNRY